MMRRIPVLVMTVYLTLLQPAFADLVEKENWGKFIKNATVLGLTPGEMEMDEVLSFFGAGEIIHPHKKHDLAWLCYKNKNADQSLL